MVKKIKEIDNEVLWRYIDFTKFVDLLVNKSMFFTRLDKLDDKFEGSYPIKYLDKQIEMIKNLELDEINEYIILPTQLRKNLRRYIFVNCWHRNKHESAAMWKLYVNNNEGIAIQSKINLLKQSLMNSGEAVWTVPMWYIDYDENLPSLGPWGIFRLKRKSFEYERELRAFIQKIPKEVDELIDEVDKFGDGILVKTDLDVLIDKIYVSPTSPKWFYELVKSVTRKYGLYKPVFQSDLRKKSPIY